MSFKKAERKNAKLRLALTGPAGSGKTLTALKLAEVFGKKIAVLDSERGSASLYANVVNFDVCEIEDHAIQTYLEKIADAAREGYEVLDVDSYSHSWIGKGGALETVDRMGGWVKGGKAVSPLVQRLVDSILTYPGHVIATMRSKVEHAIEKDAQGRTTVRKIGMAAQVREGTEYEFGFVLDLSQDGMVTVSKSRCFGAVFQVGEVFPREELTTKRAEKLKAWLLDGAAKSPRDEMADRIRFAATDAELDALKPDIAKLTEDDRKSLRDVFVARKKEVANG